MAEKERHPCPPPPAKSSAPWGVSAHSLPRRDPDSGQFLAADAQIDEFEEIFLALERDIFGDFT